MIIFDQGLKVVNVIVLSFRHLFQGGPQGSDFVSQAGGHLLKDGQGDTVTLTLWKVSLCFGGRDS